MMLLKKLFVWLIVIVGIGSTSAIAAQLNNYIIGGTGDMSGSALDNGGIYGTSTVVYAGDWADLMGANGGPVHALTAKAWTNTDDKVTGAASNFSGAAVGMGVYIYYVTSAVGEWHVITSLDTSGYSWIVLDGTPDYADQNCNVNVGGAWLNDDTGIQQALDVVIAGETIEICANQTTGTTYTLAAGLATNTAADGTAAAPIKCQGVDGATGIALTEADTYPVLQASANMTNMLLIQNTYFHAKQLHFDGNGKTIATGILVNEYHSLIVNCLVEDVDTDGILMNWMGNMALYCEVWDVPGDGIEAEDNGQGVLFCSVHDCGLGIRMGAADYGQSCIGNRAFNNTTDGILWRSYGGICANNVSDHNSRGVYIYSGTSGLFVNNSCTNNTTYGYSFQAANISWACWGNNHAYGNGTAHCSDCTNANWASFLDGGNIVGNPLFVGDYTNGDYRVQASSPLLNVGCPSVFGYETDRGKYNNYPSMGMGSKKVTRKPVYRERYYFE